MNPTSTTSPSEKPQGVVVKMTVQNVQWRVLKNLYQLLSSDADLNNFFLDFPVQKVIFGKSTAAYPFTSSPICCILQMIFPWLHSMLKSWNRPLLT